MKKRLTIIRIGSEYVRQFDLSREGYQLTDNPTHAGRYCLDYAEKMVNILSLADVEFIILTDRPRQIVEALEEEVNSRIINKH
jgi:hypothetical protein